MLLTAPHVLRSNCAPGHLNLLPHCPTFRVRVRKGRSSSTMCTSSRRQLLLHGPQALQGLITQFGSKVGAGVGQAAWHFLLSKTLPHGFPPVDGAVTMRRVRIEMPPFCAPHALHGPHGTHAPSTQPCSHGLVLHGRASRAAGGQLRPPWRARAATRSSRRACMPPPHETSPPTASRHAPHAPHARMQSMGAAHGGASHCEASRSTLRQPAMVRVRVLSPTPPQLLLHAPQPDHEPSGQMSCIAQSTCTRRSSVGREPCTEHERSTPTILSIALRPKPSSSPPCCSSFSPAASESCASASTLLRAQRTGCSSDRSSGRSSSELRITLTRTNQSPIHTISEASFASANKSANCITAKR